MELHYFACTAILLFSIVQSVEITSDPCAGFTDCLDCAGVNGCGWCSKPVTYSDGSQGPQCASPSASAPFTCSGIYSTNQCLQGYLCDQGSGACRLAAPGQGVDFETCNAACTVGPTQKVYGCHPGSNTCVEVPAGTPGSASRQQCETHCVTPPAVVYACNASGGVCVEVPPGTPGSASKLVCEATGCNYGSYGCDLSDYTCKSGLGNSSQEFCTKDCMPPNDPCMNYTTCDTCLAASSVCGWCSQNVTYVSGLTGGQCAGVNSSILPFNCLGTYSTKECTPEPPTAAPGSATPSPNLPPIVDCPAGSMVLLQYNCQDSNCNGCNTGTAAECMEPHCTLYCSGKCQPVPYFGTSFMWSCNGNPTTGTWTNATLVHFLDSVDCTGAVNPPGTGGSGTFPLNTCGMPFGPNRPAQYNTFMCVPCGPSCSN
jgi:hypothetical protein